MGRAPRRGNVTVHYQRSWAHNVGAATLATSASTPAKNTLTKRHYQHHMEKDRLSTMTLTHNTLHYYTHHNRHRETMHGRTSTPTAAIHTRTTDSTCTFQLEVNTVPKDGHRGDETQPFVVRGL